MFQHRHTRVVLEPHIVEHQLAADVRQRLLRRVFIVFGSHLADFADAIQAGERFGQLRADRGELDHRHRHQGGEGEIGDQIADRHLSMHDFQTGEGPGALVSGRVGAIGHEL